jgi:predicted nucleic acid-binding protein
MKRAVLWDSSAILALIDRDDRNHQSAVEIGSSLARDKRPAVVTNYIEVEAHALLLRRVGRVVDHHFSQFGKFTVLGLHPRR